MPEWSAYKQDAIRRGALALELYVVESTPVAAPELVRATLGAHLDYQRTLETVGNLAFAGPLSDETGEQMEGSGLIIYRAASLAEARELADGDPMHAAGARSYTLRRWLVNEGSLNLAVGLSTKAVSLS